MAWDQIATVDEPSPGRRRGRATAMVVLELGLDEVALADALTWARGRVDELLAALDDAELRALLEPEPRGGAEPIALTELVAVEAVEAIEPGPVPAPAPAPAPAVNRRTTPRYSLVEPAVVAVESWQELVALYTKDIGCGGMFVQTDAPPQRDVQVAVQLLLPGDVGALDFEGVVVHVVTPEQAAVSGRTAGFGLQFSGLTAERRRALQRLVERAEAAAARPSGGGPTREELGFILEPSDGESIPPPPPYASEPASLPAPAPRRARTTPPPSSPSLSPVEAEVVVTQQRARLARRLASNLVDRSRRLATRIERRDPQAASPRPPREDPRALVEEAMRLVADKRYPEAAQRLELAVQRRPELRTRVLLCVVQARQALTERDFPRARARYEAVLKLDPSNELAQRELLMLSALVR